MLFDFEWATFVKVIFGIMKKKVLLEWLYSYTYVENSPNFDSYQSNYFLSLYVYITHMYMYGIPYTYVGMYHL